MEEENKRVSLQVTSLSTQLIELVEKQSKLEEQLHHFRKENTLLKSQINEDKDVKQQYEKLRTQHQEILSHNRGLGQKLQETIKQKDEAKEEVFQLQREVEELSASLFDEANNMVSDARREAFETTKKNESLVTQLKDRDLLVESLKTQLEQLKNALHERDEESISARNSFDESRKSNLLPGANSSLSLSQAHHQPIYTPSVSAIRFDLKYYGEFKKFAQTLGKVESIRHTETKFLKKLITDDIEPALRFDLAQGISWLSKRSLMSSIIDGRVSIEPVSGINETYRLNFQQNKGTKSDVKSSLYSYPPESPPIAINEPCAVCGEDRDDILEHSRLYSMKVHSKPSESALSPSNSPLLAHQYPLCSFCLFRVRSCCELFAFLRGLKSDIWKLDNEITMKKAWVELSRLRAKLFWSKVGIWDLNFNILTTKITPSTDDSVLKLTSADTATSAQSSQESLHDSSEHPPAFIQQNSISGASGYKSSPLSRELNDEKLQPPLHRLATEDIVLKDPEDEMPVNDNTEDQEGYDADLFDDYSHDEQEEEDNGEEPVSGSVQKTNSLQIHTERPQDALLNSEEPTPVVEQSEIFESTVNKSKDELSSGDEFVDAK